MRRLATLVIPSLIAAACCPAFLGAQNTRPKMTWHWHMHQPIYWNDRSRATGAPDRYENAWESIQQKDGGAMNPTNNLREIFGKDDRVAAYQYRMRDSLNSIGSHANSGIVTSYSGALMENVMSLAAANQLGYNSSWKNPMLQAGGWTTTGGARRFEFTNFSFHHGFVALLPEETAYMEIRLQQEVIRREFGEGAVGKGFFPTEMGWSNRLIPTLKRLGIEWTIVSGEHIARACPDFPITFGQGGIGTDPPNRADQLNPNGVDFIATSTDRGVTARNANPLSYQPAYTKWVNPDTGEEQFVIAVPADQGFSWRDGYQCIDAGFLAALEAKNNPQQPSLVLLSHDGDNAFGGGYSYYNECVQNLANDARNRGNEVTGISQYLLQFPPSTSKVIHVEDGSWINADGDFGSPSYINWNYPLLDAQGRHDPMNGWHEKIREMAIFVATDNRVRTAQQMAGTTPNFAKILSPDGSTHAVDRAWHYHLGSFDSGNVYYGVVEDFEVKGTLGANEAARLIDPIIAANADNDVTEPTIFVPQRFPYNPGGLNFGVAYANGQVYQNRTFIDDGDFHIWTFIHDVSGPVTATLKYRLDNDGTNPLTSNQNETYAGGGEVGAWQSLEMTGRDFPKGNVYNKPGLDYFELPLHMSRHYGVEVAGFRDVLMDYYIEATDGKGNIARSPMQHVYIGTGEGSSGGGGDDRVTIEPDPPARGDSLTITYDATGGPLDAASQVYIHIGRNDFQNVTTPRPALVSLGSKKWEYTYTVPLDAMSIEFVFTTTATGGDGQWDNNGGQGIDWRYTTVAGSGGTPTPTPNGTPTPTPIGPGPNPFTMDGVLDAGTCAVEGGLYVKEQDGWLYVAATGSAPDDGFIYISSDPSPMVAANWAKAGQVGRYDYFLAMEGSNNYSSWFTTAGSIADAAGSQLHARNGTFIEGAIRKDLIGATAHVAFGRFATNDAQGLTAQSPPPQTANGNIEANEFFAVVTGVNPCALPTPTPSPTQTPTPTPTPDPGVIVQEIIEVLLGMRVNIGYDVNDDSITDAADVAP